MNPATIQHGNMAIATVSPVISGSLMVSIVPQSEIFPVSIVRYRLIPFSRVLLAFGCVG